MTDAGVPGGVDLVDALHRSDIVELAPVLRRAVELDPATVVRVQIRPPTAGVLVRLPFDVTVGRAVTRPAGDQLRAVDAAVAAGDLLDWLDRPERPDPPAPQEFSWLWAVPPSRGWRRIDTVPGDVLRSLVRSGSRALEQAAPAEGISGRARAGTADALLDSVVLTVTHDVSGERAELTLRMVSALTRMGFLPPGSSVGIDITGRWTRASAAYGSVYAERPGAGLPLLRA